jgi:hypothetical protein
MLDDGLCAIVGHNTIEGVEAVIQPADVDRAHMGARRNPSRIEERLQIRGSAPTSQ